MAGLTQPSPAFWAGKRVLLTGHTGFKGGWLTLWLARLGATVRGYALPPATTPDFFSLCQVAARCAHQLGDVRDAPALRAAMAAFQPEIVLHLAAQPLVRASYAAPVETFATNVMGTANLLEAARHIPTARVILIVTSDKVYAESRTARHDEASPLGGGDPYSASKACAELLTAAFPMPAHQRIATVRSGNVIGGGDWAADRLVPDFFRGIFAGEPLLLRNPAAVRPWQHVLDPLCGYLLAAEHLWRAPPAARASWNFGPDPASEVPVATLAAEICQLWGKGAAWQAAPPQAAPHEAPVLRLDSEKARRELGWRPGWALPQALAATVAWYQHYRAGGDMAAFTQSQIEAYETA